MTAAKDSAELGATGGAAAMKARRARLVEVAKAPAVDQAVDVRASLAKLLPEGVDPNTDLANAHRLVGLFGADLRFVPRWQKWVAWDGKRWSIDDAGRVLEAAKSTSKRIFDEASAVGKAGDDDGATARFKWAQKSQQAGKINAMVELARTDPRVVVMHENFDTDPWLLNVHNGTVDLRTGELRPHRRDDFNTLLAAVAYNAHAVCPTWERFVSQAMGGDADLIAYLQRMTGYALTGTTREHVLGFFFGGGSNGKTTFLNAIRNVLGDYAAHVSRGVLFPHRGQHPTELTNLFRRRFVTCAEVNENDAFDEARVKDLTGGDRVTAHRMYEDFWEFDPTHKLFLAGNHKPRVRGTDDGIWRRIRLIPFTVTVPAEQRDTDLPAKLAAEAEGILAWSVRGCLEWQRIGLGDPPAVLEATAEYRKDSDELGQFFGTHLHFDPEARLLKSELTARLKTWADELGMTKPPSSRAVAERMRAAGASASTMRIGGAVKDCWAGARLRLPLEVAA